MTVYNGTTYHDDTPIEIVNTLETYRFARNVGNPKRVRIFLGNTETGEDWGEVYMTVGYIGRSTGISKIPLLIHNRRSYGGPGILDHCIVRIMAEGRDVYRHPTYDCGKWRVRETTIPGHPEYTMAADRKMKDGPWDNHGNFRTRKQAERFVDFMTGKRRSH